MFRIIFSLLIFVSAGLEAQEKIQYSFRFDTTGKQPSLHVQLQCKGSSSGITIFKLPDSWANQDKLFRAVHEIHSPQAISIKRMEDSVSLQVVHQPGMAITLHYILRQDWKGSLEYPMNYRAVIQQSFIQVTGHALFIIPSWEKEKEIEVELNWANMPAGWTIGNSLHSGQVLFKRKILAGDLQNSFYVAGDFRLHKKIIEGQPVFIAIRGKDWKFEDSAMVNSAARIIYEERKFWNEYTEPYYFISLIPFDGKGNYNGSALHQSFMMGMTKEFGVDSYFYKLLAHEYFHKWNGVNIIMKGEEQENAWFVEGFTEYYTHKILYKSSLISEEEYLYFVNKTIAEYYLSPVRNASKQEMGKNFWATREYRELPYKKGFTYALYIDELIIKSSGGRYSLDNVLYAIKDRANIKTLITEKMFTDLVKEFAGNSIEKEHKNYVHAGELVPVLPTLNGKQFKIASSPLGAFDLGFDMETSLGTRILQGVITNGAAWKAGLRNGQNLVSWSIQFDNILVPAEITISDENSNPKKISYLPMKEEKVVVPQFVLHD